jgi:Cu+-exporting ATPase
VVLALVKGKLRAIAKALRLSRITMKNIRQNLFVTPFYNAVGLALAAGVLYPKFRLLLISIIAGAAMSFSLVYLVGSALRFRHLNV